jgi:ankyrin repeat protein
MLLRYGANVNSRLKTSSALIVAAVFGSESVLDLLLTQEDIDVNT